MVEKMGVEVMGTKKGQRRKTARRAYGPIKKADRRKKSNVGPEGRARYEMVWRAPLGPRIIRSTTRKLLEDFKRLMGGN